MSYDEENADHNFIMSYIVYHTGIGACFRRRY